GDALCAFHGYLSFPEPPGAGCGVAGWDVRGDVDCNGSVTPGDALCIFHSWLNGSCTFCGDGPFASAERGESASVSVCDIRRAGNDYVVMLAVAGIDELEAFGFDIRFAAGAPANVSVFPAALTADFDEMALKIHNKTFARVGAYTTTPAATGGLSDLLELRFTLQPGLKTGHVTIDGFVDDLAGAGAVTINLGETENDPPRITRYALYQNHPNPFNPDTEIRYEIPEDAAIGHVTLSIYNVEGLRVRQLVDKRQGGGLYRERWDGRNDRRIAVSSGVYFYVLRTAEQSITRKMVLLR
ncbi:MAG: T9SS type A sorting domain-containing protein, partial [Candidatus Krumholzibacteria bacterium]|nr:T9SS type A sorting domain-containing protein [Candidatus Krumholzibacteria bacterium]